MTFAKKEAQAINAVNCRDYVELALRRCLEKHNVQLHTKQENEILKDLAEECFAVMELHADEFLQLMKTLSTRRIDEAIEQLQALRRSIT